MKELGLSRRELLISGGKAALVLSLPFSLGCESAENVYFPHDERNSRIENRGPFPNYLEFPERLDVEYLQSLIENLKKETGTKEGRAKSVMENLAWVSRSGSANCLMIDENGYFIAAGHTFGSLPEKHVEPNNELTVVYIPKTGLLTPVRNFIIAENHDIAIFFAPTGKPRKPIGNINFSFNFPDNDTRLWMYSLYPQSKDSFTLNQSILTGTVTQIDEGNLPYEETHYVEGMKAFGGSSGSPIITPDGKIVAVESGVYPGRTIVENRNDYQGARVVGISSINSLLEEAAKGNIYTLPIKRG